MKKNQAILLITALSVSFVRGQSVSYTEIYDDPTDYKKLFINLHFFNVDFATPSSLRLGLGAEFMLNKRLSFSADVDRSVLGQFPMEGALKKISYSAEGGGVFNYFSKVVKGKVHYGWKEGGSSYKLKVDGKVLRTAGLRAGVFMFSSAKDLGYYKAMYNTAGTYAGIIFGAIRNKSIKAEGVAHRHTDKETKGVFYIDALFAPVIAYSDNTDYEYVIAKSNSLTPTGNFDTLVTKNTLGARMGWMKTVRYPIPLKFGFEVGLRPGLQKNFFFLTKLAVSIGAIRKKPKE